MMVNDMDVLYENIRKFRIEKKIRQDELSKKTGYSTNAMITRIEKGDVDLSYSKIKLFAEALGVSVPTLMGFADKDDVTDRIDRLQPKWKDDVLQYIDYATYRNELELKKKEQ